MEKYRLLRGFAATVAFLAIIGCGGGGNSNTTTTPSDPSVKTVTIASVTSPNQSSGQTFEIAGTNLDRVRKIIFGTYEVAYNVKNSSSLEVQAPNIPSGTYVFKAQLDDGSIIVILNEVQVTSPEITSINTHAAVVGSTITMYGNYVSRIKAVYLNEVKLELISANENEIVVRLPAVSSYGKLGYSTSLEENATIYASEQYITVYAPITYTGVASQYILQGDSIAIRGTNLDQVTNVSCANTELVIDTSNQSDTSLTVKVPSTMAVGSCNLSMTSPYHSVNSFAVLNVLGRMTANNVSIYETENTVARP